MQDRVQAAASRLAALRATIRSLGLNGFIVPNTDAFQNESVPPHSQRLAWLTGFTGSAGCAVILEGKAALIVDSRYTLQAKAQVDASLYAVELFPKTKVGSYLAANAPKSAVIGYDPTLPTMRGFKALEEETKNGGLELRPIVPNPIDELWQGRPAASHFPIVRHGEEYAGESAASKIARVQKAIEEKKAAGLFVSAPDAVAWLFNIRGRDVANTPVALVRAYVPVTGKPVIFTSPGQITAENQGFIEPLADIHDLASLADALPDLIEKGTKVIADPAQTTLHVADALKKRFAARSTPIVEPNTLKIGISSQHFNAPRYGCTKMGNGRPNTGLAALVTSSWYCRFIESAEKRPSMNVRALCPIVCRRSLSLKSATRTPDHSSGAAGFKRRSESNDSNIS